jgi:hypothetical protein
LAVVTAFSLPVSAQDTVKGAVEALNKDAKRITISGNEYSLRDEAAQADVEVGDEVEATVENGVIINFTNLST